MGRDELMAALRAEFADEVVRFDEDNRPYIPPDHVEQRLDEVVGPAGWTWEVLEIQWLTADGKVMNPNAGMTEPASWVVARGRLRLRIDGEETFRDGEGSARVQRSRQNSQMIVDPGDNLKGACSNAFKKAALRFGVGAYLRDDAVKGRIQQSRSQAGRAAREASGQAGHRQGQSAGPAQGAEGGSRRDPTKTVRVRVVQNPVLPAGGGRCEVLVEDLKGHRALLVGDVREVIAVLREQRVGSHLQVRGIVEPGENGVPRMYVGAVREEKPDGQAPTAPPAQAAGAVPTDGREIEVTIVGRLEKGRDGTGRVVVSGASGEKGVLVTPKQWMTSFVAAQKPGAKLVVAADVIRDGGEVRLTAKSLRPVLDQRAS